jgi:hypothetical protein
MEISKDLRKRAEQIAQELEVKTVFVNDKKEFFTVESLALNSVEHDRKRLASITVGSIQVATKTASTGGDTETGTGSGADGTDNSGTASGSTEENAGAAGSANGQSANQTSGGKTSKTKAK